MNKQSRQQLGQDEIKKRVKFEIGHKVRKNIDKAMITNVSENGRCVQFALVPAQI